MPTHRHRGRPSRLSLRPRPPQQGHRHPERWRRAVRYRTRPIPLLGARGAPLPQAGGLVRHHKLGGHREGAPRHLANLPAPACLLPPAHQSTPRRCPPPLRAHLPAQHQHPDDRRPDHTLTEQPRKAARRSRRPEVPLHNNQRENDLRASVCRHKISGGTRPDAGRDCRDAFLTLMKTCQHHNISFWDYLGDRLGVPGAILVQRLPDLPRQPEPNPLPAHSTCR